MFIILHKTQTHVLQSAAEAQMSGNLQDDDEDESVIRLKEVMLHVGNASSVPLQTVMDKLFCKFSPLNSTRVTF